MSTEFVIPGAVGPGTQPSEGDGQTLDYMEMPREMATFDLPIAPEPEDTVGMEAGKARLNELAAALKEYRIGAPAAVLELGDLAPEDLGLVNQILGEGEVSMVAGPSIQVQEAVFAGVWRVLHFDDQGGVLRDTIEVAAWPDAVQDQVFATACSEAAQAEDPLPPAVFNAPALLSEIADKVSTRKAGDLTHSINLSLLPHTEEDLAYLADKLGVGGTIILSRGYGNCRVSSTATNNVWWVQYYNAQDAIILNSIEITEVPEVVCAAQEDIDDSAERLMEIMAIYND
ncbi:hydrogenase expression/formation C-terminal domain-containing protein [Alisedimentitalea sp. MJ-SS2]|uniref:hydrogenase expression/formation protein n=1 Tax=Aliisedimentitalea sp. MJ-SS2 TaxID=3049795 RepID=UPI00290DBEDE|nr:hydrogenase expression/formation C-terminal domain-containing protein [Alisedimentitalea sp. MJ-SS2]MDU8929649.1 hydrogenase expression/formation C-terminal domain-containing protein [Alisedimentitalea sp. MJ-SS2]